jgi:hypothetical protein
VTAALYHQKLARALDRMGSMFAVSDILERIADGRMQSFVEGESWMITQIFEFPRGRALDVFMMIGDLDDCLKLFDRALIYAKENGIGLVSGNARRGWRPYAEARGWRIKATSYLYEREP